MSFGTCFFLRKICIMGLDLVEWKQGLVVSGEIRKQMDLKSIKGLVRI